MQDNIKEEGEEEEDPAIENMDNIKEEEEGPAIENTGTCDWVADGFV